MKPSLPIETKIFVETKIFEANVFGHLASVKKILHDLVSYYGSTTNTKITFLLLTITNKLISEPFIVCHVVIYNEYI